MAQAAQIGKNLFGWQLMAFPLQTLLFLNVPIAENETQNQFVMNTLTGAWFLFTGWNANCFEIFNDNFTLEMIAVRCGRATQAMPTAILVCT